MRRKSTPVMWSFTETEIHWQLPQQFILHSASVLQYDISTVCSTHDWKISMPAMCACGLPSLVAIEIELCPGLLYQNDLSREDPKNNTIFCTSVASRYSLQYEFMCPGRSTSTNSGEWVPLGGGDRRGEFALQVGLDCCAHGKDCWWLRTSASSVRNLSMKSPPPCT